MDRKIDIICLHLQVWCSSIFDCFLLNELASFPGRSFHVSRANCLMLSILIDLNRTQKFNLEFISLLSVLLEK